MNNPFDFGRNMLQAWEETMGQALEKLTHDESFIKNMSKALSGSLDIKAQTEGHMEKYLQSINMPTRTDLERMLQYLQRIEQKLLDIEDRLAESQPVAPAARSTPVAPASALAPAKASLSRKGVAKKTARPAKKK